jgi:hypothetical protein
MNQHSIFGRQWWTVSLRTKQNVRVAVDPGEQLETLVAGLASAVGGSVQKIPSSKRGVSIINTSVQVDDGPGTTNIVATLLLQTKTVYFPLAEENLESGQIALDEIRKSERDFPRRIIHKDTVVFQYPLLVALSTSERTKSHYVLSSPYFMLLKDLMRGLRPGSLFSSCVAVDVGEVFNQLRKVTIPNGVLTVRSGRMVITGIEYLRTAVFFGDNVIASPLYERLTQMENVTVQTKDCRLRRSYLQPVGDNRRPFVCWFDPHGNFRFTPGGDTGSTIRKFLELLLILSNLNLLVDSGTLNPPTKVGVMDQPA